MIEVEKKLKPPFETICRIKNDATFIVFQTINDVLYDYQDLTLIKNNMRLRRRNGKFELKVSKDKIDAMKNYSLDINDEIDDEAKICEILNIKSIEDENFVEVVNLVTKREKYKLGSLNIDFDFVTSPNDDFTYQLMEVEIMVENESDIPAASEEINAFMAKYNILDEIAVPKIIQYFYKKKRHILDIL
jgi:adenylate cyclase class IV